MKISLYLSKIMNEKEFKRQSVKYSNAGYKKKVLTPSANKINTYCLTLIINSHEIKNHY